MYKLVISAFAIVVATGNALAEPPPDELVQKLTKTIRQHCPDAKIETTKTEFVAKFETMMFTLHRRNKGGDVFPDTYQEEGPNAKGFILRVALNDGPYQGAADVPQTLGEPYFSTYIDAPAVNTKDQHYFIGFSYGSRLDKDLKNAIFEAIPKTRFQPAVRHEVQSPAAASLVKVEVGEDVQIHIEETARDARTSTVRVTQNRRGTPTADTFLLVCGMAKVADARGATYFANLKEWPEPDGSRMYVLGFADTDAVDLREYFGKQYSRTNDSGQPRSFLSTADWRDWSEQK